MWSKLCTNFVALRASLMRADEMNLDEFEPLVDFTDFVMSLGAAILGTCCPREITTRRGQRTLTSAAYHSNS